MRALHKTRKRISLSLIVETTTMAESAAQAPHEVMGRSLRSFWIPQQPIIGVSREPPGACHRG